MVNGVGLPKAPWKVEGSVESNAIPGWLKVRLRFVGGVKADGVADGPPAVLRITPSMSVWR